MTNLTRTPVEADLGLGLGNRRSLAPVAAPGGADLLRKAGELQRKTQDLMTASAPETFLQKVGDWLAPSAAKAEQRRGDRELVKIEVQSQIDLHKLVKQAEIEQMRIIAEAHERACKIEAAKAIAARGLEAAEHVDGLIEQTGQAFDMAIEQAVDRALALSSESARESAGQRIGRRKEMRAQIEQAVMEGVEAAVRGGGLLRR